VGVNDKKDTFKRAFRFEVWGSDLIVQRELEKEMDLTVVQELSLGHPGRTQIQANLDQVNGRILVFSAGGARLADMTVGSGKSGVLPWGGESLALRWSTKPSGCRRFCCAIKRSDVRRPCPASEPRSGEIHIGWGVSPSNAGFANISFFPFGL
jgi:hypothetical protein